MMKIPRTYLFENWVKPRVNLIKVHMHPESTFKIPFQHWDSLFLAWWPKLPCFLSCPAPMPWQHLKVSRLRWVKISSCFTYPETSAAFMLAGGLSKMEQSRKWLSHNFGLQPPNLLLTSSSRGGKRLMFFPLSDESEKGTTRESLVNQLRFHHH